MMRLMGGATVVAVGVMLAPVAAQAQAQTPGLVNARVEISAAVSGSSATLEAIERQANARDRARQAEITALQTRSIDIIINNAGLGVPHDVRRAAPDPDAADGCLYANLSAPIRLITALLPRLRERTAAAPQAAIINVTSGLAIAPNTASSVYCASKAGLRSYTLALRAQLKDAPILVIEALPPVVDTQMTADRSQSKMPPEECARQILAALEKGHAEANVGMVKLLRAVYSLSPALARSVMLRF
jgi:uncharacterized oxidoreductase